MKPIFRVLGLFPVLLASALLASGAAAQGSGFVPFKGHFTADIVTGNISGHANHMGHFTGSAPVTNTPTGFSGTLVWQAPDGSTITGTFQGTFTSGPPVLTWLGSATITGGTGRFAGASGSFSGPGVTNLLTLTANATFQGTISSVGSQH